MDRAVRAWINKVDDMEFHLHEIDAITQAQVWEKARALLSELETLDLEQVKVDEIERRANERAEWLRGLLSDRLAAPTVLGAFPVHDPTIPSETLPAEIYTGTVVPDEDGVMRWEIDTDGGGEPFDAWTIVGTVIGVLILFMFAVKALEGPEQGTYRTTSTHIPPALSLLFLALMGWGIFIIYRLVAMGTGSHLVVSDQTLMIESARGKLLDQATLQAPIRTRIVERWDFVLKRNIPRLVVEDSVGRTFEVHEGSSTESLHRVGVLLEKHFNQGHD
jgi:hypothetical protein